MFKNCNLTLELKVTEYQSYSTVTVFGLEEKQARPKLSGKELKARGLRMMRELKEKFLEEVEDLIDTELRAAEAEAEKDADELPI